MKQKRFVLIIILLIITVLAEIGYFAYKNEQITQSPIPSITTSPLPPTADNYKIVRERFILKYPDDWKFKESRSFNLPYILITDPLAQKQTPSPSQTEITQGAFIELYMNSKNPWYENKNLEKILPLTGPGGSAENYVAKTIGKLGGVRYSLKLNSTGIDYLIEGFGFSKEIEGEVYIFDLKLTIADYQKISNQEKDKYINIFNQIISDFIFLDAYGQDCAGPKNLTCPSGGYVCKLNINGKPQMGGKCVNESESFP